MNQTTQQITLNEKIDKMITMHNNMFKQSTNTKAFNRNLKIHENWTRIIMEDLRQISPTLLVTQQDHINVFNLITVMGYDVYFGIILSQKFSTSLYNRILFLQKNVEKSVKDYLESFRFHTSPELVESVYNIFMKRKL